MLPDNVTATALVSLDKDVIATASKISEGDSIEELRDRQGQGEEERSTYCFYLGHFDSTISESQNLKIKKISFLKI